MEVVGAKTHFEYSVGAMAQLVPRSDAYDKGYSNIKFINDNSRTRCFPAPKHAQK